MRHSYKNTDSAMVGGQRPLSQGQPTSLEKMAGSRSGRKLSAGPRAQAVAQLNASGGKPKR